MRTRSITLAILALVALLAVGVTGCKKQSESARLGLKPGVAAPSDASSEPGSASAESEDPKASTSETATGATGGTGATNGQSGGSGSNGSSGGSSNGGGSNSSSKPTPTPVKGMTVKILWWNDTKDKAPSGVEIVYGASSFKPNPGKDAASGSVGPVVYGKEVKLVVYPDGRDGKKLIVPFTVEKAMISNSEQDAIHVEISDDRVRVLGNPVSGFERAFDRF